MKQIAWPELKARLDQLSDKLSEQPTLYHCHHCQDVGQIIRRAECEIYGKTGSAVFSSACPHCDKGQHISRCDEVYYAQEKVRRHERRQTVEDANQSWIDQAKIIDGGKLDESDDDLPF